MSGHVLIIDGVATNRIVLKVKLATASYETRQAGTASEAKSMIAQALPWLVILASTLPDADGIDLCRQLTSAPGTANIPVIVTGSESGSEIRMLALAAGADDYLSMPIQEHQLQARVRNLLRRHNSTDRYGEAQSPVSDLSLAESGARFELPGLIAIVGQRPERALGWKTALAGRVRDRITVQTIKSLLHSLLHGPVPDVFVIEAGDNPLADLRLIAELRSRPETEGSAILMVQDGEVEDFGIMALDLGASDVISTGFEPDELAMRIRSQLRQKKDRDQKLQSVREGLRMALTDPLTGLLNRRAAFSHLRRIALSAATEDFSFGVMVLDVDRFKGVNDQHGHAAGDSVLVEVARRLTENLRSRDVLGRIGGEEFLIVLPKAPLRPSRLAAERLRHAIEAQPFLLPDGTQIFVTLSIGLAIGGGQGSADGPDSVLDQADKAMFAAKSSGRNTVTVGRSVA